MRRSKRIALGMLVALGVAAPAAHAFEVKVPTASPADTRAGQHSDFKLRIELSGGNVRDVDIHLPPGLVGNPNATPRCTIAQFEGSGCPPETKVGTSRTEATVLIVPQTLNGDIFNIEPRGSEPARLGIVTNTPNGPLRLESPVFSRTTDGGLDSQIRNIPQTFSGLPITVTALETTLLGTAGSGKPFMSNPTSCGTATTTVDAVSYADEKSSASASFESVACQELPFAPSFEANVGAPGRTAARTFPPLTTVVGQTDGQANVKRVRVTLPNGLAVAPTRLNRVCLQEQFAAGQCPPGAKIGDATAVTPLLTAPLSGPVTFVAATGLPEVVLSLTGPINLTLRGTSEFTPQGQATTFDGIFDVPLSRFELRFLGGDEGLLEASRDLCAQPVPELRAEFTSHAGTTKTMTVPATVTGCSAGGGGGGTGGGDTPAARPRPKASLRLGRVRGGRPSLRLRVTGSDGVRVRRVRLNLAKGLRLSKRTRLRGAKPRSKRRAIEIPARRGGTRRVSLTLRAGTLTVSRKARRAKRLRFSVVITDSAGRRTVRRVTVRPRR
jgi:hypothetical protein